eukprot:6491176-Amphidinium_carterae.1
MAKVIAVMDAVTEKKFAKAQKRKRQGQQEELNGMEMFVKKTMQQKPLSIESLYKHALGLQDLPDGASKERKTTPLQSKKYEMACELEVKLSKEIDRRMDTMMELSVQTIQTVLCSIKPSIITPFNLASMAGKGSASVSKKRLCELLTFCTGMKGSQPFYRAFPTLKDLSTHLVGLNASRGDMAALITWPLNWEVQGVYRCRPLLAEGLIEVTSIYANKTARISMSAHNFDADASWDQFVLRENYSVKEATLQQKGKSSCCELHEYFRGEVQQVALQDRAFETPPGARARTPESAAVANGDQVPALQTGSPRNLESAMEAQMNEGQEVDEAEAPTSVVGDDDEEAGPPLPPDMVLLD